MSKTLSRSSHLNMVAHGCNLELQEVTKLTKQILIEEALSEQMKERQEMERKLQKLSKTMDHLERAKREEERPLIDRAHLNRLADDEKFYKEQQEVRHGLSNSCCCLFCKLLSINNV